MDLHEPVALKFMLPEALENPEAVERFLREARAAVKIKSEHVAKVTDVGRLEGGEPYIVMEYLKGTDLSALLALRGTLPVEEAIEHVLQACEAVAEAHTLGIIHRDLKPSNLFLTQRRDGTSSIKVLDFGISKMMTPASSFGGGGDVSMTRTSQPLGTPLYMPPEQMASARHADARSDIWSVGVILFELVTGAPPFNGASFHELRRNIAQGKAPSIRGVSPSAPEALDAIIQRCLEKEPAKRYQNISDLAADLAALGSARARGSAEVISRMIEQAGLASTAPTPVPGRASALDPTLDPPRHLVLAPSPSPSRGEATETKLAEETRSSPERPSDRAGQQPPVSSAETPTEPAQERARRRLALAALALVVAAAIAVGIAWMAGGSSATSPAAEAHLPSAAPKVKNEPPGGARGAAPVAAATASAEPNRPPIAAPLSTSMPTAEPATVRPPITISGSGVTVRIPGRTSPPPRAAPTATAAATAAPAATKPKDILLDAEIK
jgi:serine/threonine protein kinase